MKDFVKEKCKALEDFAMIVLDEFKKSPEGLEEWKQAGTKLKNVGQGGSRTYTSTDTGRFDWGEDRVMEYNVGPFRTSDLEELRVKLAKVYRDRMSGGEEKVPATIDARPKTVYADVVKVLDQAIDSGFTDITFVGAYPDHIE